MRGRMEMVCWLLFVCVQGCVCSVKWMIYSRECVSVCVYGIQS